jgi:cobalt/nickel transport system permease protein
MHIVDGALSNPVVIAGALVAAGGIARGLKQLEVEKIPAAGVLSAAFFVASLIHVPVGPSSVHLILNGLAGLVLGWAAFPALFVGLLLQAVFFGFGGVTVLGVNTVLIAGPAVMVHYLCVPFIRAGVPGRAAIWGAIAGALSLALTAVMVAGALMLSGQEFWLGAKLVVLAHLPVMAVEAVLTGAAVYLMALVKPELFARWERAVA